jgi:hypothetical protein
MYNYNTQQQPDTLPQQSGGSKVTFSAPIKTFVSLYGGATQRKQKNDIKRTKIHHDTLDSTIKRVKNTRKTRRGKYINNVKAEHEDGYKQKFKKNKESHLFDTRNVNYSQPKKKSITHVNNKSDVNKSNGKQNTHKNTSKSKDNKKNKNVAKTQKHGGGIFNLLFGTD